MTPQFRFRYGLLSVSSRLAVSLLLSVSFVCLFVGCGSGALSTANAGTPPPHGGSWATIPGGQLFLEVVKNQGPAPIQDEVTFYLYRDAAFTPCDTLSEAVLEIDKQRKVSLIVDENSLTTPQGPILFGGREVEGLLRFELDGEVYRIPLGVR